MSGAGAGKTPAAEGEILLADMSVGFGGVTTRVLATAAYLDGRVPYRVVTVTGSHLDRTLEARSLRALRLPHSKWDPRNLLFLTRYMREHGVRLVDAHNVQSQLFALLAGRIAGVPRLISSVHLAYARTPGGLRGRLSEWILHLDRALGCEFITVSTSVLRYLEDLGADRVALIHNGVDFDALSGSGPCGVKTGREVLIEITGRSADTCFVAFVGRLVRQKGLDFLLEAADLLRAEQRPLHFVIIGDGELGDWLAREIERRDLHRCFSLLGYRADVDQLLSGCDAFCLPSRAEGLPFALLEACAHKLPLILSSADGMGELFTHDEHAKIHEPGDTKTLALHLSALIDERDHMRALGENAWRHVRRDLAPETMLAKTAALYGF